MSFPPSGHVHVWYTSLDPCRQIVEQMEYTLAAGEWARLRRFHFAADARRYAVRRGVLRHLLAAYLDARPKKIAFVYGAQNKPALAPEWSTSGLRFNLSDSGEMAVYAFAVGQGIGVDIEQQRVYPDARQLAARFFSRAEAAWLRSQPQEQTSSAFLRCWTCKEAVVKAQGDGLMAPLREFTVAHWSTPPRLIGPTTLLPNGSIHLLEPPPGYIAALASAGAVEAVHERCVGFTSPAAA